MANVYDLVAPSEADRYGEGDTKILLIDAGAKNNIVRSLVNHDTAVIGTGWWRNLLQFAQEAKGS